MKCVGKKIKFPVYYLFISIILMVVFPGCTGPGEPEKTIREKLQQALDDARTANNGRGAAAAVMMPGENFWQGVSGNSHDGTAINSDMIFAIGSVSKTFTAALVLKLVEEGILNLEDRLSKWLPTYANIDGKITIRQLLNHTSGVFGFFNNGKIWDEIENDPSRFWEPEDVLPYVLEPYFAPGAGWHYTNTNYLLLRMIINKATGANVSTLMRNRFWNALRLNSTYLCIEETLPANMAHMWSDLDDDGVVEDVTSLPRTAHDSITRSVFSTAGDLVRWSQFLFQGSVLERATLDQMLDFVPTPENFGARGYGLGITQFFLSFAAGQESIGHTGAYIGHIAIMVYLPNHQVSIAVLVNDENGDCLYGIKDALIQVILNNQWKLDY